MAYRQSYLLFKANQSLTLWVSILLGTSVSIFLLYKFAWQYCLPKMQKASIYSITVHVPSSHVEKVKQAMFDAGAGRSGLYEHCAWQTLGQGQFKPLPNSQPFIGKQGMLEKVDEYAVKMICDKKFIHKVIAALKAAHPYETASYKVIALEAL